MNGDRRGNDWWRDFINLLATAYFLKLFPKLEAQGLKVLVWLKSSRLEEKAIDKV